MSVPLPEPNFIDRDPAAIVAEMVADYEATTGKTLQPAQVERLLVDVVAYRESLVRLGVQEAAKQNLVTYARYPMLDHIGRNVGVDRLQARSAVTRLQFNRAEGAAGAITVPAGTTAELAGIAFATDRDVTLGPSASTAEVSATATAAGAAANGYLPAAVSLRADIAGIAGAATAATTYGGADAEDDERYRARIMAGANRNAAGTPARYRELAMGVDQTIADVSVVSPSLGLVRAHILVDEGTASDRLLADVLAVLTDDRNRMVTDQVEVRAATARPYVVAATLTLVRGYDAGLVMTQAEAAVSGLAARLRRQLGGEIVPSQFVAALSVAGVHRVTLDSPAELALAAHEYADCTAFALVEAAP